MSVEEALDILGLKPAARLLTIREAHRRLEETVRPELGDTHYLTKQINEARDVLLEHAGCNKKSITLRNSGAIDV
jgi:hypothetical protein